MLRGNEYFCSFSVDILCEIAAVLFSPTAANDDSEIFSYLAQFSANFSLRLFIVSAGREVKIQSQVVFI